MKNREVSLQLRVLPETRGAIANVCTLLHDHDYYLSSLFFSFLSVSAKVKERERERELKWKVKGVVVGLGAGAC